MEANQTLNVVIASYLEPELIDQVRQVSSRLNVVYEPELLAPPRYPADHSNTIKRAPEQEARWRELLGQADVLFDFDATHRADLPDLPPRVRWIQASSAGIGQFVRKQRYAERMPNTTFTTASGVHSTPLAEFCIMAMLMWSRNYWQMQRDQQTKRWERFGATDLPGRTVGILGVGNIGMEVARLSKALGMTVLGAKRNTEGVDPASLNLDELHSTSQLDELLSRSEYLVLVLPHTDETENMINADVLAKLPRGAVLINIGRGATVDEPALIEALQSGHLGGAALDVFAEEPLPAESPLWAMPNVLVSPHSASTSDRENQRLVELFCRNLESYLNGSELENVLDVKALY